MPVLQGTGYVPGLAVGMLQYNAHSSDSIALISQTEAAELHVDPAAVIVIDAAPLSHRLIGLAARGIPTVLISGAQARLLQPGTPVCVDGATGRVSGDPEELDPAPAPPAPTPGEPVYLADGTRVRLMASVRGTRGVARAIDCGANCIGLARSEFIGRDLSQPPDARYLRRAFRDLVQAASPLVVTIRLLDLAPDKPPGWLDRADSLLGPLGLQGARLFTSEPVYGVLEAQLTAIAGLAESRRVEVLIPYLCSEPELAHWVSFVRDALPRGIPVGAMLETPAAVMALRDWQESVDFVAIGCNDLMQCFFGADRDEPRLRDSLDPYAPALYRLLHQASRDIGQSADRVRLCGVLSRMAGILPILIGLGYRSFSVDPVWVPYLARDLSSVTLADAEALAVRVMHCSNSREVKALLDTPEKREPDLS